MPFLSKRHLHGVPKKTTQTVGYKAVGSLEKVRHPIPLLSLGKTKMVNELAAFLKKHAALLMLKLDGLTVKLVYEDGKLVEGSTRGDSNEGELITHNVSAFRNVPLSIPYRKRLVITGEGFIHKSDFERLKDTLTGSDGKPYRNARNLAAGSIRCLDANICREREISFFAFNILEGMDEFTDIRDSRSSLLLSLSEYGFGICPFLTVSPDETAEDLAVKIKTLTDLAEISDIPIDGMVLRFDSFSYSASLGRTGHHYNDGIAFKSEDDTYETVFRSIEWQTERSGEIPRLQYLTRWKLAAMNIRGLSEATLDQLIRLGALKGYQDLYHLDRYRDDIIALEGFGEKSYENLIASIYLFYIRVLFATRKTIQIATDKTAESCYNLRKRGMLFMANKTNTIQELNLADSFLFGKVMSDTEICRMVLEKILNVPIKKAEFPVTKKIIDIAPDSGDIRLDACINDDQDTIYSVEMLCCKNEELLRKTRYFQCNIDSDIICTGENCTKLKKSYIIFICTFDPFSDGRHIYTFENRCLEDLSLALGDETTEIFLSTKGEKDDVDDEIKDFLAYIENSTDACAQQTSSPLVRAIHKRVTEIKLDKDMELQYMTLLQ